METKKINRLLLWMFVLHIVVVIVLTMTADIFSLPIVLNLSLGELIIMVPAIIYLIAWKLCSGKIEDGQQVNVCEEDLQRTWKDRLHFNKVRPSTLAYVLIFTWLSMPLTTLINAISMLFVDNTILAMSNVMLELPFIVMLFLIAVMPATCEEIAFRGIVYGGYRKEGQKFQAVLLSGFMFGIMHMNLNQALYAFVIGVLLALLFEATNSIFATMLFHFIYNAQSCCLMYIMEEIMPGYYSEAATMAVGPNEMYMMISVYLVLAAIFTPIALCMLYKIAKNENRVEQLKETLPTKKAVVEQNSEETTKKGSLLTVSYILASIIAIAYIVFEIVISKIYQ